MRGQIIKATYTGLLTNVETLGKFKHVMLEGSWGRLMNKTSLKVSLAISQIDKRRTSNFLP